jgi:hypothetical protein
MTVAARKRSAGLADLGVALDLAPMEAKLVTELPKDAGWQFEPKWDGFRCLAFRAGRQVEIKAKSGKSLSRFFPEVLENLRAVSPKSFVLDGELVIPVDGSLSFDALQMRLHPAQSRITRLSNETPATFIAFDCLLRKARQSLLLKSFKARRAVLEGVFEDIGGQGGLTLTPFTRDKRKAEKWLGDRQVAVDGVVAKRLDLPYLAGERAMLKVKRLRTADCVVGGFRYETGRKQVGSLLLGLYDSAPRSQPDPSTWDPCSAYVPSVLARDACKNAQELSARAGNLCALVGRALAPGECRGLKERIAKFDAAADAFKETFRVTKELCLPAPVLEFDEASRAASMREATNAVEECRRVGKGD